MMAECQQKEQLEAVQREKSHQGTEVRVKVTEKLMAAREWGKGQGHNIIRNSWRLYREKNLIRGMR